MTTITIDRAVVEQALDALELGYDTAKAEADRYHTAMAGFRPERHAKMDAEVQQIAAAITALRAALARQAGATQEPHRDLRAALRVPGCERLREWVEIGPVQRAALETFVETFALAQEQAEPPGCEHCNHPLYAATKCRVCGRVTEPKGGGNLPPPLQEPAVAENATTQQQLADTPPSDYQRGYWDGFNIGKREGRIEAEDAAKQAKPVAWMEIDDHLRERLRPGQLLYTAPPMTEPVQEPVAWLYKAGNDRTLHWNKPPLYGTPLYTAPPQRKPLTDEEIDAEWQKASECAYSSEAVVTTSQFVRLFARAVERAHGIGDSK